MTRPKDTEYLEQLVDEMQLATEHEHRLELMQRMYHLLCARTGREPELAVFGDMIAIAERVAGLTREIFIRYLDA